MLILGYILSEKDSRDKKGVLRIRYVLARVCTQGIRKQYRYFHVFLSMLVTGITPRGLMP
jgi:hypothetical protein